MSTWETLKADAAYLEANIGQLSAKSQEFAKSLIDQFNARGLSAKQEFWVSKLADEARERAARAAQPETAQVKIDLTKIVELFRKASTNLKKPFVLVSLDSGDDADRLRLKLAGPGSKYKGQVYVYLDNGGSYEDRVWLGRVDPERAVYVPSRDAESQKLVDITTRALVAFSADPVGAAVKFGRKVGACCFCSRQLNDPRSITVGYGPICADHFGLPWGEVVEVLDYKDPSEELGARPRKVVEYAGFRYEIAEGQAVPLPGQHPAANKDKHRRAALELAN